MEKPFSTSNKLEIHLKPLFFVVKQNTRCPMTNLKVECLIIGFRYLQKTTHFTLAILDFLCGQKVGEQWQMVPYSP